MSNRGVRLAVLRIGVVSVWFAAMLTLGWGAWKTAAGIAAFAVLLYTFWPRPKIPHGAMTYDRASAIVIPDWLGIVLACVMFALPFWAAPETPGRDWVHPMAWLVWPMGMAFLVFTVIGWQHEAFVLSMSPDGLAIDTGTKRHDVKWAEIEHVAPWSRDLPRWMRRLVPVLVASGNPVQAGAIMVARASSGLAIHRTGAKPIIISTDAFATNAKTLMAAFEQHDIRIARGLSHLRPKKPKPVAAQESAK